MTQDAALHCTQRTQRKIEIDPILTFATQHNASVTEGVHKLKRNATQRVCVCACVRVFNTNLVLVKIPCKACKLVSCVCVSVVHIHVDMSQCTHTHTHTHTHTPELMTWWPFPHSLE